jgi:hypothetical protein
VERVVSRVPAWHQDALVYLNVPDSGQPYSYNPLSRVSAEKRPLVASGWRHSSAAKTRRCPHRNDHAHAPASNALLRRNTKELL